MTEAMKVLKAYHVQGDEYGCIRFAHNNVTARREGANELDTEFNAVSCKRIPGADKYAEQGRVPVRALVEEFGWWQECGYCYHHVSDETDGRVWDGDTAYCGVECEAREMNRRIDDEAERLRRQKAEHDAVEVALAKFPGISDVTAYEGHKKDIEVYFRFPGGTGRASWPLNSDHVGTTHEDSEPFKAYLDSIRSVAISETAEPKS